MKIIVNKESGDITRLISNSTTPQTLNEGELELEISDQNIIDAFNRGEEILYNKATGKVYYQPKVEIDPEKAVLYEAVANLFEEVEALKEQLGGARE